MSATTTAGMYSSAENFGTALVFVTTAFGQAWSPFVVKLYAEDPHYRDKIGRIFSYWFFGLAFIGLGISLFGYEILMLTTPEPYWPAATTLSVLTMGMVLMGTTQFTSLGISLERKSNLLSIATWITAVLNLLLNLVLIPMLGALGAGIATFVSYAVLTGMYMYWTQNLHRLPLETKSLLFSIAVVVLMPPFVGYLNTLPWGAWIVAVKLSACALVLFLAFATRTVKLSDLRKLIQKEKT